MVKYVDVMYGVTKVLKDRFPKYNILINGNQEDIVIDTFSVYVLPVSSETSFSRDFKVLNVFITYINPENDTEKRLITMQEVEQLFHEYLSVGVGKKKSRLLPIFQKNYLTNEKIQLTLNYYDDSQDTYDSTYNALMEIISMNMYINNKEITTKIKIERKDE